MHEPAWFPEKTLSTVAVALAAVIVAAVLLSRASQTLRATGVAAGPVRRGSSNG
jgi:hypothetical protein